ncbi:TniB family NTP-binding protein [Roseivivax sp. THAF30]|uniref:TniB family NTP-binding protein n=1 Tax=Roseivivax sp. THAF30 TaxID=2587852 RepID=UPI001268CE9C|nr:TniB family NTP-binding protein [Roseivivax sp. THAF30]QFT61830.1 hypothetical protein FIU91_02720 [Roseivivax sp. THAF30]
MTDPKKIDEVMERIRNLHFGTDVDAELERHLDRLLKADDEDPSIAHPIRMGRTKETRGILFVDAAGAGKTTAIDRGLSKHPRLQSQREGFRPYLFAEVPTDPSLKSMATRLLEVAGYKFERTRRTTSQLFDHLRELMQRNGQVVLWIDEAHDLMTKDRDKILRATKSLMQGPNSVIVIMSGTQDLEVLLSQDDQVRRRFSIVKPEPLDLERDGDWIMGVFDEMCKRSPVKPLDDPSLASRVLVASRYRLGRAIEMLENGIERALWDDAKTVDLQHFADAYSMQEGGDIEDNPFLVDDWKRIDPDKKMRDTWEKRRTGR